MNKSGKIEILKEIRNSKGVLFGCFSKSLTKQHKIVKWQEIHVKAQTLGIVPMDKDYKYTRDTFWQNVRKNAMKKMDNAKKTGSEGGPDCKYSEVDNIVFDIIGKDSPAIMGLPVTETWEEDSLKTNDHNEGDDHTSRILTVPTLQERDSTMTSSSFLNGGNNRKTNLQIEADLKMKNLKLSIEILEKESYLKTLKIEKLERELGIASSIFTNQLTPVDYVIVDENICVDEENTVSY